VALAGCPLLPGSVTVVLVNETNLDVRPNLHTSAEATSADELFQSQNLNTTFTDRPFPELRPSEAITLTFDCNQLQAVGVDRPVLFDAATLHVTVSPDRIARLRGTDFECGATIRFVFFRDGDDLRVRVE